MITESPGPQKEQGLVAIRLGMTRAFALIGERTVVVDAGYPGMTKKIMAALNRVGVGPKDIALILITHGHLDHFGSAAGLKAASGAPVAVHAADADNLRQGINPPSNPTGPAGKIMLALLGRLTPSATEPVEPDITFTRPPDLTEYGLTGPNSWQIIHTPGHTPGSISLIQPGGPAILGDVLMGRLLRPAQPGLPFVADDPALNLQSLKKILSLGPTRLMVAHGGPFNPDQALKLI